MSSASPRSHDKPPGAALQSNYRPSRVLFKSPLSHTTAATVGDASSLPATPQYAHLPLHHIRAASPISSQRSRAAEESRPLSWRNQLKLAADIEMSEVSFDRNAEEERCALRDDEYLKRD